MCLAQANKIQCQIHADMFYLRIQLVSVFAQVAVLIKHIIYLSAATRILPPCSNILISRENVHYLIMIYRICYIRYTINSNVFVFHTVNN